MSISFDLFYNPDKDTYKIRLQPDAYDSGNLSVRNIPRMIVSDRRHHDLFGKNVSKTNLPDKWEHYTITSIQELFDKYPNQIDLLEYLNNLDIKINTSCE